MKNIFKLGCLLFLLAVMVSCKSAKPTVNETSNETQTITETLHDTIFRTEKDSSSYKALLQCLNGKVVMKQVTQAEPGRNLKSPKVRIENNQLQVDCEARAQELLAHWKSKNSVKSQYKTITEYKFKITWWQQTQIYGFWLLLMVLSIYTGWLYIKPKFL